MKKKRRLSISPFTLLFLFFTSFTPLAKSQSVTDIDGNVYHTVTIGTQTWMVENLKTTHYRDGSPIENNTYSWRDLSTGAWTDYSNKAANGTRYGHLYNWYAVSDGRNIAPLGWHVPTDAEWTTLTDYVTANLGTSLNVAKALAATTDWDTYCYGGPGAIGCDLTLNNTTGFTALPGGHYSDRTGFDKLIYSSRWWSATESSNRNSAIYREMDFSTNFVEMNRQEKEAGSYVRCIRDSQ